eukprot:139344_1
MSTEHNDELQIAVKPLLPNSGCGGNNDAELAISRTVLNLNNKNVRITLWSLIYIVLTTGSISNYIYGGLYWNYYRQMANWEDFIGNNKQYYSLGIATNNILLWSVALLLSSLYCGCCRINCNICCGILFFIGSIMQCATIIDGIGSFCANEQFLYFFGYFSDEYWCNVMSAGNGIFLILFTFYLGIDVMRGIGDNIKVRLMVTSIIVLIRSLIMAIFWLNTVYRSNFFEQDFQYFLCRMLAGANLTIAIICIFVIVATLLKSQANKGCPKCIIQFLSYVLLIGTGTTTFMYNYAGFFDIPLYYYVPAAVLLVYDLQYL